MLSKTPNFKNENLLTGQLFDVSKLAAVVTGGGTGIGLMIAQALAVNGARVYIIGRRKEALEAVAEQYSGEGKIVPVQGDISIPEECMCLAKKIEEMQPGGINLLVNNAGIARDQNTKLCNHEPKDWTNANDVSQHMLASDPNAWKETFQMNATSQFFMAAAFVPLLAKANEAGYQPYPGVRYTSSIVNITSISGFAHEPSSGK